MPPGTREVLHCHERARQFFYILGGKALFHVDGKTLELTRHQGIKIEPGQKHFIENKTDTELEFLVISQPSTNGDRIIVE